MIATNHALTGALVATAIGEPLLGLPAALLSHFVIDAIPHWNYQVPGGPRLRQTVIGFDILSSAIVIIILAWALDVNFWLFALGGMLAILPDTMWLPNIISDKLTEKDGSSLLHMLRRLHKKIQWSETTKGLFIELAYLVSLLIITFYEG